MESTWMQAAVHLPLLTYKPPDPKQRKLPAQQVFHLSNRNGAKASCVQKYFSGMPTGSEIASLHKTSITIHLAALRDCAFPRHQLDIFYDANLCFRFI
ncbi:hypothetical protein STEG23_030879 [Scotinomys teguina]